MLAEGGWAGELVGIDTPTPVPPFIPVIMFAVLFGLSMDYEVFLLVARPRGVRGAAATRAEAVTDGLARTARVITAAAAIMVAVFGAFALSDEVFLKLIGVGLATAILVDATIVRLVLVPGGDAAARRPQLVAAALARPRHPERRARARPNSVLTRSTTTGASALTCSDDDGEERLRAVLQHAERRASRPAAARPGPGGGVARRSARRRRDGRRAAPVGAPARRARRRRTPPAASPRRALAAASSAVIPPPRPRRAGSGSPDRRCCRQSRELPQQPVRDVLDHAAAPEAGQPAGDREVRLRVHARAAVVLGRAC